MSRAWMLTGLVGLVLVPAAARADVETIFVPPTVSPSDAVESTTFFEPGHQYRVTITLSVEIHSTDPDGHQSDEAFDAWYCFSSKRDNTPGNGCVPPLKGTHLYVQYTGKNGEQLPTAFTKVHTRPGARGVPKYRDDHRYVLLFDNVPLDGTLTWTAEPHRKPSVRASYSGGFRVRIEEVFKPCVAPAQEEPVGAAVTWSVLQAGPPRSHPDELTDSISVTRGAAEIHRSDTSNEYHDDWDLERPKGVLCHKDRFALEGHATREEHFEIAYLPKGAKVSRTYKYRTKELDIRIRVTRSDDPDCPSGSQGKLTLYDRRSFSLDGMTIEFNRKTCESHNHDYRSKRLDVKIAIED